MTLRLDQLPYQRPATVASVDWSALTEPEQRRLRNLGLDEGVEVEALHGGPFGRDPMAVRIGRMTLAMRRVHARVVHVSEGAGADKAPAGE
jgi:ferrous iron transport protein A